MRINPACTSLKKNIPPRTWLYIDIHRGSKYKDTTNQHGFLNRVFLIGFMTHHSIKQSMLWNLYGTLNIQTSQLYMDPTIPWFEDLRLERKSWIGQDVHGIFWAHHIRDVCGNTGVIVRPDCFEHFSLPCKELQVAYFLHVLLQLWKWLGILDGWPAGLRAKTLYSKGRNMYIYTHQRKKKSINNLHVYRNKSSHILEMLYYQAKLASGFINPLASWKCGSPE